MTVIHHESIYLLSDNIVSREINGEIIIIPLVHGIADADDDLFSLSPTARDIWQQLDGRQTVGEIIQRLADEYQTSADEIAPDVCGFLGELQQRRMVYELPISAETPHE